MFNWIATPHSCTTDRSVRFGTICWHFGRSNWSKRDDAPSFSDIYSWLATYWICKQHWYGVRRKVFDRYVQFQIPVNLCSTCKNLCFLHCKGFGGGAFSLVVSFYGVFQLSLLLFWEMFATGSSVCQWNRRIQYPWNIRIVLTAND